MRTLTQNQARRLALGAQGFSEQRPGGRIDVRHFRKVLATVGVLQLDTVNVLVRAHYLPLFSRLGSYDRAALDRWTTGSGELFEYWGHMASLLPTPLYPRFRWRMQAHADEPWGSVRKILAERPEYIDGVLDEVRQRGPLTVGDLDDPGERGGPWWGYQPGKHALEWLFACGLVSAYRTANFSRLYDLPERVIAEEALSADAPDRIEAFRMLLMDAGRHLAVGTAADLADYHRLHVPTARKVIADLAAAGDLEPVAVDGWGRPAFVHPEAVLPRRAVGTALLSPFDSLIFNRDRVERLFDFHYRIEIYVPKPKRQYGYYVLPFLLDGELVGRVDLKADRKAGKLHAKGVFVEEGLDERRVAGELADELRLMSEWLELDGVRVGRRGNLANALRSA
ncbi:MAG: YcaQ family DNA glycosylase, partial [Acidobacteria bacterium]|nr:YcaQ family DNA glycosylase [Acidobacteriota bacterium]